MPAARADGDPASDYLLAGLSFLSPYDGHIPAADQKKLNAMLASAKKQGFPLKVAVIVTPYDLGAVPILFNAPQSYAKFLADEDFYYWKDELLVVMPNGYGIYKAKSLPAGRQGRDREAPGAGRQDRARARGGRRDGDPGARGAARAHALDRRQQRAGKQLVGLGRARRDRRSASS